MARFVLLAAIAYALVIGQNKTCISVIAQQPYQNDRCLLGYEQEQLGSPGYVQAKPEQRPSPTINQWAPTNNITPAQQNEAALLVNRGNALLGSGNIGQAIDLFKRAIAINPSDPVAHLDLASALIRLRLYDAALAESTAALSLNPNYELAYVNYFAAAAGSNHLEDALSLGKEYFKRFPNGTYSTNLKSQMRGMQNEMKRRKRTRGIDAPIGAPDNYLSMVTPHGKCIWPPYCMPLKVYIYPGQGNEGFTPQYVAILIDSFMTWQNATNGVIRFVPAISPEQANIECQWSDTPIRSGALAGEGGDAQSATIGNSIAHVTITILTHKPDLPTENFSPTYIREVCLHEIGHALGIQGHSDEGQDIMYWMGTNNVQQAQLSRRDLNTLWLLYH